MLSQCFTVQLDGRSNSRAKKSCLGAFMFAKYALSVVIRTSDEILCPTLSTELNQSKTEAAMEM